jgi:hypothetical protein
LTISKINLENKSNPGSSPLLPIMAVILCLLPFVNKAFHVDDPLFLWTAQQIQKHPLDFYGFPVHWYDTEMPMAEVTKNPPLASYYLAGIASITGYNEIGLHLGFIPIAIAAAAGTFYLSRRLGSKPVPATLIAVLTPVFLVSGTTLMCDMMLLAFWVWALFFWLRGIDAGKKTDLLLSMVLVCLAIMTKYFGITLLALLGVYAFAKKPKSREWLPYLLIPLAVMLLYQWLTAALYGKGLLYDAFTYVTEFKDVVRPVSSHQTLIALAFTGGCLLPVLFFSPFIWSAKILRVGFITPFVIAVILYFSATIGVMNVHDKEGTRWDLIISVSLMAATGISLLGAAWDEFRRNKGPDTLMLLLWILGTFFFAGFMNWTINARSLLPMVPAAGILIARRIEKTQSCKRWGTLRYMVPLILSLMIAMAVAWADYAVADKARTAARISHNEYANDHKIWFEGHWGFQYYMQQYGHKPVDMKKRDISAGDMIVVPLNNINIIPLRDDLISLKKVLRLPSCQWLATMQKNIGAGFYSHYCGPVPFLFGNIPPETYYLFEVNASTTKK